jgi:hypothetical protein
LGLPSLVRIGQLPAELEFFIGPEMSMVIPIELISATDLRHFRSSDHDQTRQVNSFGHKRCSKTLFVCPSGQWSDLATLGHRVWALPVGRSRQNRPRSTHLVICSALAPFGSVYDVSDQIWSLNAIAHRLALCRQESGPKSGH